MGTYAGIFKEAGSVIPENRRNEFAEKIEKIFQTGGMMEIERIQLYGKKILMLRKVRMKEDGMNFCYNYFEEDSWENAGFDRKNSRVWSNKIGWSQFNRAIVTAYVLEELYTDGIAIAMIDNAPVTPWGCVGWINYLFGEENYFKNSDPWKVFEAVHYSKDRREECMDWRYLDDNEYSFIGGCEIYAVLYGYEKAISVYGTKEKGELEKNVFGCMQCVVEGLKDYSENCGKTKENQLQILMEMLRTYYETDEGIDASLRTKSERLYLILLTLSIADAPAFVVKVISEIYEVEFWDLWEQIRDVAKRKRVDWYGSDEYYVAPVSTERFFEQSPDDMIPFWEEGCALSFTEELQDWFKALKVQYDNLLETEFSVDNTLKYVVDLLEEVNENYCRIFAFYDFFEETLENSHDKRYQILWKMFDEMIHDPEMKKAGDVIFVPDEPGHEKEGLHYLGEQPKRRLICTWEFMDMNKKNNKARVTFRRYMALVGNKELRFKVFGF